MASSESSQHASNKDGVKALDPTTLVERLRPSLESAATSCSSAALEKADKALNKRLQATADLASRERMDAAIKELRRQRDAIIDSFQSALAQNLQRGFEQAQATAEADNASDGWRLMDRAEIEEEVAIQRTGERVRRAHGEALQEIERRLSPIVARDDGRDEVPFDPTTAVRALAESLRPMAIDVRERMLIYQVFGRELRSGLGDAYRSLNQSLANAGYTADWVKQTGGSSTDSPDPEADHRTEPAAAGRQDSPGQRRSADNPPPDTTHATAGQPGPAERTADGPRQTGGPAPTAGSPRQLTPDTAPAYLPSEQEVVSLLHQWVETVGQNDPSPEPTGASEHARTASVGQATDALTALQRQAGHRQAEPLDAKRLKTLLTNGLHRRTGADQLDRSVSQTIDIVSMLFEVILEDERLPGAVEAQFARLQVPVLKVAMTDNTFLASSTHPARRLFNRLARSALTLVNRDNVEDDPIYWNIRATVEKVVDEFHHDVDVFDAALDEFESWQWQSGRGSIASGHARNEANARQARSDAVRSQVSQTIETRLASAGELPDVLAQLLREAWFKVMFVTGVKHGVDSELLQGTTQVMDSLIWSLTPREDPVDRAYVAEELPNLLQRIHDGLNSIMYPPGAINELIEGLRQAHAEINPPPSATELGMEADNAAETATPATANVVVATFDRGAGEGQPSTDPAAAPEDSHEAIVRHLSRMPILSWFDIVETDGRRHRACLQARVDDGQTYVFANRHGERVVETTLDDLARDVAAGRARPLEEGALLDRAIETIIAKASGDGESAAPADPPAAAS